jgi:hypothetical protein
MNSYAPLLAVTLVFSVALIGFFKTKTPGWGAYTTSILLLLLILFIAGLAFSVGQVDWPSASGLLLAIAGYAGGIVTTMDKEKSNTGKSQPAGPSSGP